MDIPDYDPGTLNDYGGGNVDWWFNYIRAEINGCNEYWREQLYAEPQDAPDKQWSGISARCRCPNCDKEFLVNTMFPN